MRSQRHCPFSLTQASFCLLWCGLALFPLASCRHKKHAAAYPQAPQTTREAKERTPVPPVAVGYTEQGVASWYGIPYHGRPAADGEIYNMETLVAAHRTMPFNTWLRVTNLRNQKSVEVRVIDRGPFVGNRILDLSKAAARQIDLIGPGVGSVKLQVISAPIDVASNDFYAVQIGAFAGYENAERLRTQYATRFGTAQLSLKQGSSPLYRVLVGKVRSTSEAAELADRLRAELGSSVFIVRLDQTVPAASPASSVPSAPASLPQ